jgi:hypothetical protein
VSSALPARAAIAIGIGLAIALLNDPLAGLVIGFMLAQVLIVYPRYQAMQLATVAARRNRSARPDPAAEAEQAARRAKLVRYLLTQFVALGVVLLAASGMVEQNVAIYVALPVLAGLTWLQLRILE